MLKKTINFDNDGYMMELHVFECNKCGCRINTGDPHCGGGHDEHFCWECSYLLGKIPEREFLKYCGVYMPDTHATIKDDEVIIWWGKTPPWEIDPNKAARRTKEYKTWRTAVFERDNYTCQKCGKHGGIMNAHHIQHFSKNKKLRYELSNGVTLCNDCHKKEHSKGK